MPVVAVDLMARHPGVGEIAGRCAMAAGLATLAGGPAYAVPPLAAEVRPMAAAPSIGTATMLQDGTVLLQLRANGPGGVLGDALLRYPPSDPNYAAVRAHLPALRLAIPYLCRPSNDPAGPVSPRAAGSIAIDHLRRVLPCRARCAGSELGRAPPRCAARLWPTWPCWRRC